MTPPPPGFIRRIYRKIRFNLCISDEVAAAEVPVAVNVATPTPDDVSLDEAMTAETSIHLDPVTIVCWLPTAWTTPGYEALRNNRQRYADMHGYNFLKFDENNLPTHELTRDWASMKHLLKPNLLLHLVQHTHGWIIWMDADTLFTNFTTRWSELLRGDVVFAEAPDVVTNNGVFALHSSLRSRGPRHARASLSARSVGCLTAP
jgi:hypothetical protein